MKGEVMERLTYREDDCVQLKRVGCNTCKEVCEENLCDECPINEAFERLAMYEDLDEKGCVTSEEKQIEYDKLMKVNWYLAERCGDGLWKEFGVERTGDNIQDLFSVMKIIDKIYEIQKEKYPAMWYEYSLCNPQIQKQVGDDFKQSVMDRFTKVE